VCVCDRTGREREQQREEFIAPLSPMPFVLVDAPPPAKHGAADDSRHPVKMCRNSGKNCAYGDFTVSAGGAAFGLRRAAPVDADAAVELPLIVERAPVLADC
jgi:hypothetical protein